VAIGEWVTTTNDAAKFGEFEAEDPRPLLEVMEGTLRRMSARSRTPLHELLIKGDPPSGKALKAASTGITSATEERQTTLGNSWEDSARIAWRIGSVFGDAPDFDPDAVIDAQWKSAEVHDEEVEAGVHEAELRMGVVSRRTISEQRGYDWGVESERIDEEKQESLKRMSDAFNQGGGAPFGGPPSPPQPPGAVGGGE
jgi:hypothetical protein